MWKTPSRLPARSSPRCSAPTDEQVPAWPDSRVAQDPRAFRVIRPPDVARLGSLRDADPARLSGPANSGNAKIDLVNGTDRCYVPFI